MLTSNEPISRIRVKNFRCLEELIISFENSPIIALSAGNDSGKSSVVKAIETIMYNDERDDKNYIRTGTKGFEIDVEFADGTCISRVKGPSSNMYYLYDKDSNELGRWGSGTGDAKLGTYGIPDIVKRIFNVKLDDATGELLNLRTCESLLLFSLTKTTDNYKMVHSCISSHRIEKAYEIGNQHIKDATRELDKAVALRDDSREQAAKIKVLPEESLERLRQNKAQLEQMVATLTHVQNVVAINDTVKAKQQELDLLGGQTLKTLEENQFSEKTIDILSHFETSKCLLDAVHQKEIEAHTAQVAELTKHSITTVDIERLQLLELATTTLHDLTNLLENGIDPVKITEVDSLFNDTVMKLANRVTAFEVCIALNTQIAEKEQALAKLDKLNVEIADFTAKSSACEKLSAAVVLVAELNAKTAELQAVAAELKATQDRLLTSGGVSYDAELNALIKTCEHCHETVAFELSNLQLL